MRSPRFEREEFKSERKTPLPLVQFGLPCGRRAGRRQGTALP